MSLSKFYKNDSISTHLFYKIQLLQLEVVGMETKNDINRNEQFGD